MLHTRLDIATMYFCVILYGLLSLSSKAWTLVVGTGCIYRLKHSCTVEHIPLASLPSEDIVATRPTGYLFQCAKDCETDERCGSFSLTDSCMLLNAEENVCDTSTGIYRKVRSDYCANGGTFVNHSHCECPPLWGGPFCDLVDVNECASTPCGSGECTDRLNHYECTCNAGFEGINCEININECASNPCVYGQCNDAVNMYTCACQPGYHGTHCDADVNECASNPCVHGTCTNNINHYTCTCNAGYTGTNCDGDINECASNPCVYGSCSHYVNYYTCSCNGGYTGTNCDSDFNECASNPCVYGTCNNYVNYYTCSCTAGYTSTNCNLDVNECASNPCGNYGVCNNYVNYYTCSCNSGWSGTNCQYYPVSVSLSYGSYGLLQVFYNNEWGTVCDDGFDINNNGCQVVCRQLGYLYGVHVECGAGAGTIWMDDVQCTGAETNLGYCPHLAFGYHNCVHQEDVGCRCCNTNSYCDNFLC